MSPGGDMHRACENCGFESEELALVRRVYLTPETWDTPRSERVLDDTEAWCLSCTSQYPHQPADDLDDRD